MASSNFGTNAARRSTAVAFPMDGQLPPMLAGGFTPIKNGEVNGVSGDAAAMNAFRAADRQVGGALYHDRRHYLQSQVAPAVRSTTPDDDGPLTFCARRLD